MKQLQTGGGYIRYGTKYLWHNWYYQELTLNQPLFKNECYRCPVDWLDPRTLAHLLPGLPYMSMN